MHMMYYKHTGAEQDVVVSTRIRLARNLAEYPFAAKLEATGAREIMEKVTAAAEGMEAVDCTNCDPMVLRAYVEEHILSPQFCTVPYPHTLLHRGNTYLMVGEEDHIRLQTFAPGLNLEAAYAEACAVEAALARHLRFAYRDDLGYLTHCTTNLGTGMRASAMLFLPALTRGGGLPQRICAELQKLGMTVRGSYGEGTAAEGALYQISNQSTLGSTEEEILDKLGQVVRKLVELERSARAQANKRDPLAVADAAGRAFGICRYAKRMTSAEFRRLYTDLRLGVSMGVLDGITLPELDTLLIETGPAMLTRLYGEEAHRDDRRDILRATHIRGIISA